MRLWWWRKIRPANIPQADRDPFGRFGEFVIGSVLAGGFTPSHADLQPNRGFSVSSLNFPSCTGPFFGHLGSR